MTNQPENKKVSRLERINVKKAYFIFGAIVLVTSSIELLTTPESHISGFIGPNIGYHLMFLFISFLPRLSGDFTSPQQQKARRHFKVIAYALIIFNCMALVSMALNLFMLDFMGALEFFPAFAFGLAGINIYQYMRKTD